MLTVKLPPHISKVPDGVIVKLLTSIPLVSEIIILLLPQISILVFILSILISLLDVNVVTFNFILDASIVF